jgi:tripartite ATP-independent transporter DctP family solute receptor
MRGHPLAPNRRTFLKTLTAASLAPLATGWPRPAASQTGPKGGKIILKVASNQAGDLNSVNWGWQRFGEAVGRRLPGAIDFQFYPAGQLGGDKDFLENLRLGTLQMAVIGQVANVAPRMAVLDVAYLFVSYDQAERYLGSDAYADLMSELPSKGLQNFPKAWWWSSWRQLTNSRRPVRTPDDVKGLKIRVPPQQGHLRSWLAFGANATPMDFTEVYTALQTGVLDGQENPAEIILSNKLYEVQKYLSVTQHLFWAPPPLASKKWWDGLPKDVQSGLEAALLEVAPAQRKFSREHDALYLKELGQKGMAVNEVDKPSFVAVAREKVWPQFEKQHGKDMQAIVSMAR